MSDFTREPPRREMLVHHTFNDVEIDRVLDHSPQGIDGTVVGDVTFGHTGVVGNAARLANKSSDVEINALSEFMPVDELFVSSWGRSEQPVTSTALNVFATVTVDGTEHNLSHTTSEPTEEWQFAAIRYDGDTIELWYGQKDDESPMLVDTAETVGPVDDFELTFYTDGYAYVDDTRVYRDSLTQDSVDDVYSIGGQHNLAENVGDQWDNRGIPYRQENEQLGGALAEQKHSILRNLDYMRESIHINDAAGRQLDRIGHYGGIRRLEDERDDKYRARIKATLTAGRSSGTYDGIMSAVTSAVETNRENVELQTQFDSDPGTVFVYLSASDVDDSNLTVGEITEILKDAVMASHDIEVIERGEDPFTVIDDAMVEDSDLGLTSDTISTGGGLVSDA